MAAGTEILVTGGDGQVGRALRAYLPGARYLPRQVLDVTDAEAVSRAAGAADVIVHLAAMTNVDGCERDPTTASRVNAEGTRNVADAARTLGARVVYVSTDYVFDGSKATGYGEEDEVNPVNVYGRTKLAGEQHVGDDGNLTIRTSWVYGDGHNFVRTICRLASERAEIPVVEDQRGRPTAASDLARALAALIEDDAAGVVHAAGGGSPCSWAELAERVVEVSRLPAKIRRVSTVEYAAIAPAPPAPRPANSTLSIELLRDRWGVEMPDWQDSLATYLEAAT